MQTLSQIHTPAPADLMVWSYTVAAVFICLQLSVAHNTVHNALLECLRMLENVQEAKHAYQEKRTTGSSSMLVVLKAFLMCRQHLEALL